MFSAGNITEKLRVAGFDCRGETVVDLYAGGMIVSVCKVENNCNVSSYNPSIHYVTFVSNPCTLQSQLNII